MQCMVTNCLAQLSAGQGSAMLATLLASLLLTSVMVTTFLASLALASNNLSRILLSVLAMLALQVVLLLQIVVQCCHYAGSLQLDIIYTNHTWLTVLLILYITFLLTLNPKYLIKKAVLLSLYMYYFCYSPVYLLLTTVLKFYPLTVFDYGFKINALTGPILGGS